MQITVNENYITVAGTSHEKLYAVDHVRTIDRKKIGRRRVNPAFRHWENRQRTTWIAVIIVALIGTSVGWIKEWDLVLGLTIIVTAALLGLLIIGIFRKPDRHQPYTIHLAEFTSGNEVFGISSRDPKIVEDFVSNIRAARDGRLKSDIHVNIDRSITADTVEIDKLNNDGESTLNFFEGADVRDMLRDQEDD